MTYLEERQKSFRFLTPEESETTAKAMKFLYKKGMPPEKIVRLDIYSIDRELKTVRISHKLSDRITYSKFISYANSPLETQINNLPNLKSSLYLFPKKVWTKRKILKFNIPRFTEPEVRELIGLKSRRKQKSLKYPHTNRKIELKIANRSLTIEFLSPHSSLSRF